MFNIGESSGDLTLAVDDNGETVLQFDYYAPQGTAVGVWTKDYPSELLADLPETAVIGVMIPHAEQLDTALYKLEIKGAHDVQVVPLDLEEGWNHKEVGIDWARIGALTEVVFVVEPVADAAPAEGSLLLSFDFAPLSALARSSTAGAAVELADVFSEVSEETVTVTVDVASPYSAADVSRGSVFSLFDAQARGVFNIGPSSGHVSRDTDVDLVRDVYRFKFTAPTGTYIGVWTKGFPSELNAEAADAVRIGLRVPQDLVGQVAVKLELKGDSGKQDIPLDLGPGWNFINAPINWSMVGALDEVVYVVSPSGLGEAVDSELYLDLEFIQLTFLQKYATFIKLALVLLLSVFLAGFAGVFFGTRQSKASGAPEGLHQDLLYGLGAVLIAAAAFMVYTLGRLDFLNHGFNYGFLIVTVLGVLIGEVLKYANTGKHLTPVQVLQNALATGILAACSSNQELLQAPATWSQVALKSHLTAAVAILIHHGLNAYALAKSKNHIRPITSALVVGTPFLFGWILLLQNTNILQGLSGALTLGVFSGWPALLDLLGRLIVVFGFNELALNAISMATKGRLIRQSKAHIYILFVSLAVVLSPSIANAGSVEAVAALPLVLRAAIAILTAALSQAGLWGEVYLITGAILDGSRGVAPDGDIVEDHILIGARKGMAYSGIFIAIVYALEMLLSAPGSDVLMAAVPLIVGTVAGALVFPLLKTIIETFDGSQAFFERVRYSYRNVVLYARGAVGGFGMAYLISNGMIELSMSERCWFGLLIGLAASAGISLIRDAVYMMRHVGKIQTWRLYFVDACLGAFVGSAVAFYLDSSQVPVIIEKFKLYISAGLNPEPYMTYPLINKWGQIDLGAYTGGVRLLFNEALAGVINWAVAAWLFAINRAFMEAYFRKDSGPVRFLFSRDGLVDLVKHMIQVLRWGLWMSPIIFTFLRMMPEATWYNQDGAIRTVMATFQSLMLSPEAFQKWSLEIFVGILAFDWLRVLIWIDHMGLRVATLVNLSFIGMNVLDARTARFIGPAAAYRYIPEGVKRFTTWAPLLIPFYIPRGEAWDYAWGKSIAIQNARGEGWVGWVQSLSVLGTVILCVAVLLAFTAAAYGLRLIRERSERGKQKVHELSNREYRVTLKENGEAFSQVLKNESDVSRRDYDGKDPAGRALFLVDTEKTPEADGRFWPVLGNYPKDLFDAAAVAKRDGAFSVERAAHGIETVMQIRLPDKDSAAEIWEVTLKNTSQKKRALKVVPYLEWVLGRPMDDRFHTQYARLFPEMHYSTKVNAVLAWQKNTKLMGILASEEAPEGFLSSRMDFIGRAKSLWSPRILETLDFDSAEATDPCPTFDPIGSLLVDVSLAAGETKTLRFLLGAASNKDSAAALVSKFLNPQPAKHLPGKKAKKLLIGHGEILPGTPQPYSEYIDGGNKLLVHTPYTPRPYDHAMSNIYGHSVMVTNRGLHTSCNGNSQQNRLTPDWADTVTREVPSEAIYLYDPDSKEWFSPTHHPLNDYTAKTESEFSVDGTAVFRMTKGSLSTELKVFVPTDEPTGVYLLTVKNESKKVRRLRVAPYFQMVLSLQPEIAGPLGIKYDGELDALYFENPRNEFRSGPAFAAMSLPSERIETKRGRFFGRGRGVKRPYLVEQGAPDETELSDGRAVAAFMGTVDVPANGEATVAVILGQTDTREEAAAIIKKYKNVDAARVSLENTKQWWLNLMGTVKYETSDKDFDNLQNWLKYQGIAERVWARRGFYQTSGAYGFRDQLQDTVNLIWVDPALARKQIILHASQQFIEGDVFHWFFTLVDGRTSFASRSHASDNLLWLVWGVVEYLRPTGDESILDEMTSYVSSELPYMPLPKNKHGLGDFYGRSTRADTIYNHCLRSIDLVFNKRTGAHGLPLIQTGDWNDGLDEIGSEGRGESVWLGLFLYYILNDMVEIIGKREGPERRAYYAQKQKELGEAIEATWREDRYLRAIHDDGTEIGIKDSGVWEIDALTAAWAVMSGINFERGVTVFHTAIDVLERDNAILLGWPALREDTKPYLGRSSKYPEGVRENGMYCHGVQWMIKAARVLAEHYEKAGNAKKAAEYREIAYRFWMKITPADHVKPGEIEIYGGQPNKQQADVLTTYDRGRMIWNGYTGAAGWLYREAVEGVIGAALINNELILPGDMDKPRGPLKIKKIERDVSKSPLKSVMKSGE